MLFWQGVSFFWDFDDDGVDIQNLDNNRDNDDNDDFYDSNDDDAGVDLLRGVGGEGEVVRGDDGRAARAHQQAWSSSGLVQNWLIIIKIISEFVQHGQDDFRICAS